VPHLPRFPEEACGVDTRHAPFLDERRTRGSLQHSVAGNRGQAVLCLPWRAVGRVVGGNGSRSATFPFATPLKRNKKSAGGEMLKNGDAFLSDVG